MAKAFKRLQSVLKLEARQGYKNKAVVGGIRQFATFWVGQAEAEAVDEQDRAFVQQVAEMLGEYGRLSGPEARQKAIENLLEKLNQRKQRVGEQAPAQKEPPPPPPPKQAAPTAAEKPAAPVSKRRRTEASQKPRSAQAAADDWPRRRWILQDCSSR
jgi:ATP-dependent DNA helicase RecG